MTLICVFYLDNIIMLPLTEGYLRLLLRDALHALPVRTFARTTYISIGYDVHSCLIIKILPTMIGSLPYK